MFHLFHGKIKDHHGTMYLENEYFGIEVTYIGHNKKWTFFIYPQIDQNQNTMRYYAFDKAVQKAHFCKLIKIQGIWWRSWYHLAMLPQDDVRTAIQEMDMKYFQQLPGIWPKTAKRIILELKQQLTKEDLWKLDIDEKLYKDIVAGLKWLGYEARRVKQLLPECPHTLDKKHLSDIMKWLINHL